MNQSLILLIFATILASGIISAQVYAEISPNKSFIVQGSGYLATEKSIKTSNIDFILKTGTESGSRINAAIQDGFVTVDDNDYLITTSSVTSLRDGKYLRVSATAESVDDSDEITISTLGRLIQNSQQGSIYTFSGRIMDGNTEYKIIYIAQLSESSSTLSPSSSTSSKTSTTSTNASMTVHILKGASNTDISSSYIGNSGNQRAGYFSIDRLSVIPGTTITFVNDDDVNHTIVSGAGLAGARASGKLIVCAEKEVIQKGQSFSKNNCDFTLDGRIDTGIIKPGKSWTGTFSERGFYRLADTDYPWMNIVAYVFGEPDSEVIRQGKHQLGN